jgi:hypothetical protein
MLDWSWLLLTTLQYIVGTVPHGLCCIDIVSLWCEVNENHYFGIVEIDECLVGGVDHGGKRGRGADKTIVVIAIEIKEPVGYGRIRMRHIPDASGDSLVPICL